MIRCIQLLVLLSLLYGQSAVVSEQSTENKLREKNTTEGTVEEKVRNETSTTIQLFTTITTEPLWNFTLSTELIREPTSNSPTSSPSNTSSFVAKNSSAMTLIKYLNVIHDDIVCGDLSCNGTKKHICLVAKCPDSSNCSMNITCASQNSTDKGQVDSGPGEYQLIDKLLMAGFSLIFVIGTLGNSIVCYLFGWVKRKHRKIPEMLFLYLGIVDLISSIVNPFYFVYLNVTRYSRWDFGQVGCKILASTGPVATSMSAIFICIIAMDRYFIIVNPFGRRYGKRHVNIIAMAAVPLGCFMHLHYIYYVEYSKLFESCLVVEVTMTFKICGLLSFIAQDFMCFVVFLLTTILIAKKLDENSDLKHLERISKQRQQEQKSIIRILKFMGALFFLFVLPRDLFHVIYTISWLSPPGVAYTQQIVYVNAALKVLHTANSCINVFIYSRTHKQFRLKSHSIKLCCLRGGDNKGSGKPDMAFTVRSSNLSICNTQDTLADTKVSEGSLTPSPGPQRHEKSLESNRF